jgi:DNA-binding LacI/PurR family transcriptional regulator/signal transduction histidine kinase
MLHSLNIGVITKYSGNNYHGALIHAIHQTLKKNNSNMFIINTFMINKLCQEHSRDLLYYRLAFNHINGWIILSEGANNQFLKMLQSTGKPVVTVGFKPDGINLTTVMEDSQYSAGMVTQHLIDHGHKKIAFIGCSYLYDMQERYEGYKSILKINSIPFDPELAFMANMTDINMIPFGKSSINKLIENEHKFTAVFAANDLIALGAIEALKESKLRIPDDVAVIGYDDTSHAISNNISLSSVRQDLSGIGSTAVETLIKLVIHKDLPYEKILVKSNIITRNSCGCSENSDDTARLIPQDNNFKNIMLEYIQNEIGKSYDIATELLGDDIDEIKNILSKIADKGSTQCIGLWDEATDNERKLFIHQVVDEESKSVFNINKVSAIDDFPPDELLAYLNNTNNIIWIFPISTASHDWGIIAYISPINITNMLFAYDSSVILFNLIGSFLDKAIANAKLNNTLETLRKTLENLEQAHEQLIISEKMVALGRLVAGVAHEINTPVGVSITASSFLKDFTIKLKEKFNSGNLKRSDLIKLFDMCDETMDIMLFNLNRASHLIKSFKQISVDQSVEEKRVFNVKEYINEILLSLKPKLSRVMHNVEVDCPEDLNIYSYAGGFSQILSNFIENTILHAFNEDEKGSISVKVSYDNNILVLTYSDDGKGISKEDISKIFDPFFTTKRNFGGTGLGLNIVYNIVTQHYKGSINCESIPEKGTTFIVKIPITD